MSKRPPAPPPAPPTGDGTPSAPPPKPLSPMLADRKGELRARRLLDELSAVVIEHEQRNDFNKLKKPRDTSRRGPTNARDRIIFQLLVMGVSAEIIAGRAMLLPRAIDNKRLQWTADGTLRLALEGRQMENEALTLDVEHKALLTVNALLDSSAEDIKIQAAKAGLAAANNNAARRAKTAGDQAYVDATKERTDVFRALLSGYQPPPIPDWAKTSVNGVPVHRPAAPSPGSEPARQLDSTIDAEYDVLPTGDSHGRDREEARQEDEDRAVR